MSFQFSSGDAETSSENIKVVIRIKPMEDVFRINKSCISIVKDDQKHADDRPRSCMIANSLFGMNNTGFCPSGDIFTYDRIFMDTDGQQDIFECVGKPMVENCLQGYNGAIFAYGQTGSGKTYTMFGPSNIYSGDITLDSNAGLVPRIIEYTFRKMAGDSKLGISYSCKCSMIEIYNETVYDLLDSATPTYPIRENVKKEVYVDGNVETEIGSLGEALALLKTGINNRHIASTSMNHESSRSHSILTLHIRSEYLDRISSLSETRESKFHLVDLAGSERQKLSKTVGIRLKEAGKINKSLLALSNVINSLSDQCEKKKHICYRDSKLTFFLKDSIGGNSKTFVIGTINPASPSESLSTLRFAQRAKMIKNNVIINKDSLGTVDQLRSEIRRLRNELFVLKTTVSDKENCSFRQNEMSDDRKNYYVTNTNNLENSCSEILSEGFKLDNIYDEHGGEDTLLVSLSIRRQLELEGENHKLQERISVLEELCKQREHQVQTERMVVKFRNSTINSLRNNKNTEEFTHLQEEIHELRKLIDKPPESVKISYENSILQDELNRLEKFVNDFHLSETRDKENQQIIRLLSTKILELEKKIISDNFNTNEYKVTDCISRLIREMSSLKDEVSNNKIRVMSNFHFSGENIQTLIFLLRDVRETIRISSGGFSNHLKKMCSHLSQDMEDMREKLRCTMTEHRTQNVILENSRRKIKEVMEDNNMYIQNIETLENILKTQEENHKIELSEKTALVETLLLEREHNRTQVEFSEKTLREYDKISQTLPFISERVSSICEDISEIKLAVDDKISRIRDACMTKLSKNMAIICKHMQATESRISNLDRENEQLSKENQSLIQHQNFKQKIQYHVKIKEENNELKERNKQLSEEINKLKGLQGGSLCP